MIYQKEPLPKVRETIDYDSIFEQLPPLKSPEFIRLLETPAGKKIPPEVLARCYRQLCKANHQEGMTATFEALTNNGNLKKIQSFIKSKIPPEQKKFDFDDLERKTWSKIWVTLPTSRGTYAEINWLVFAKQRVIEAWREEFGREGGKLETKVGKEKVAIRVAKAVNVDNKDSSDQSVVTVNPLDKISVEEAANLAPWHAGLKENEIPLIEKIIKETIEKITEPFLKQLAVDQFGDNPSPISGDRSKTGKKPLTEQTGFNRDYISRRVWIVRARLAAALKASKDLKFDDQIIRKIYKKYQ